MRYTTSFFIFTYCKASKNHEPKKQETKKLILWEFTESENEKRSWKSQFAPKSTYLNLLWTMFYYFILIVQKLNFPPSWIFQCPFSSTTTLYSSSLHSNNNFYFSNSWFQSWLYTGKWIFKLYSITSFYFLWECCIYLSILFYKFWMKLKTIKFKRYCKILPIFLDQRRIY